jgi:hypothetical protein
MGPSSLVDVKIDVKRCKSDPRIHLGWSYSYGDSDQLLWAHYVQKSDHEWFVMGEIAPGEETMLVGTVPRSNGDTIMFEIENPGHSSTGRINSLTVTCETSDQSSVPEFSAFGLIALINVLGLFIFSRRR